MTSRELSRQNTLKVRQFGIVGTVKLCARNLAQELWSDQCGSWDLLPADAIHRHAAIFDLSRTRRLLLPVLRVPHKKNDRVHFHH